FRRNEREHRTASLSWMFRGKTGGADQSDVEALDRERMSIGVHFDRRELGIGGQQAHASAAPFEALDRDFVVEARDHDAAVVGHLGAMHGDQVAVEDAGIAHAPADHAQQVIGARTERVRVDAVVAFDVFRGEKGAAGGNPADEGEPGCRRRPRAKREAQATVMRKAFEHALANQRLYIILRRTMSCKPQILRNFAQARRTAVQLQMAPDAVEDTLLVGGEAELVHEANVRTYVRTRKCLVAGRLEGKLSLPRAAGGRAAPGWQVAPGTEPGSRAAPFSPSGAASPVNGGSDIRVFSAPRASTAGCRSSR